jgi:hypothetical protein
MTGIRRQKAQSEQAAALLAGLLERQAWQARAVEQLRVRAGRGVLRKQAENAVEDTTDRTAEREWEYAGDEDSGGSEDVAEQAGAQL